MWRVDNGNHKEHGVGNILGSNYNPTTHYKICGIYLKVIKQLICTITPFCKIYLIQALDFSEE